MVATTFSSDTPNLVTDIVRRNGVAGNWVWWAFTLTGVATVFFFARLWRRSGVMTDLEFYEVRYSGKAAGVVRGFRSVYLGLFFNCMIMATVNLAACKIAALLFGLNRFETLLIVGLLNLFFAAFSGLWGVLVIEHDPVLRHDDRGRLGGVLRRRHVGGLPAMITAVSPRPPGLNYLSMLPDFKNHWDIAWPCSSCPSPSSGGRSGIRGPSPAAAVMLAQRMLASKSEKDSLGAVLFFNLAHYVLRPWPWILVALCSLVVFPNLADIQAAFPGLDPTLLGHDIAYPAMFKFMPIGFFGLIIGGLIAAKLLHRPDSSQLGGLLSRS